MSSVQKRLQRFSLTRRSRLNHDAQVWHTHEFLWPSSGSWS